MKRVGILGGTFNPVHMGHLVMAQVALERMKLDKIIFVPSNIPPHKSATTLASAKNRYNMVRLAVKGNAQFEVSAIEINRKGKSFTVDTARELSKKDIKLFFILGQDAFDGLKKWKNIDELTKLVSFVVLNRPGTKKRKSKYPHYFVVMPNIEIASSYLRKMIAKKNSIRYMVPDNVLDYIKRHKLYQ